LEKGIGFFGPTQLHGAKKSHGNRRATCKKLHEGKTRTTAQLKSHRVVGRGVGSETVEQVKKSKQHEATPENKKGGYWETQGGRPNSRLGGEGQRSGNSRVGGGGKEVKKGYYGKSKEGGKIKKKGTADEH